MSPDLAQGRSATPEEPLKSYQTILEQEVRQAEEELRRPTIGLLASGLLAGFGVGISLFLMAVMLTLTGGELPEVVSRILMANAYTVGFIAVVLSRTDLFTEYTTIAILPILTGRTPVGVLGRLWGLVYVANLAGAAVFSLLTSTLGPALGVIEPQALGTIAGDLVDHPWWVVLMSATLAGWMMGLLSWLVTAGRDTISQVFFVWLITLAIGLAHLHHSITGSVDVLSAVFAAQGVSLADFGYFLFWATLGNSVGGVVFAVLIRYSAVVRATNEPDSGGARKQRA